MSLESPSTYMQVAQKLVPKPSKFPMEEQKEPK